MIKKAISIFIIFCMLLHCGARLGIIAYFYSNQSRIAEAFCVNKDKPSLHCNGKCFLANKLKAQESEEKKIPFSLKTVKEIILFYKDITIAMPPVPAYFLKALEFNYLRSTYSSPIFTIFLPPKI